MDVIVIPQEKLEAILINCMAKAQPICKPETPITEVERPISSQEAGAFLGVSRQALYTWRKRDKIRAHILEGKIYYFKSELLAAMK